MQNFGCECVSAGQRFSMALTNCSLVYLDVGSNIGDSLQQFAHRKPEARLRETMRAAVGDGWSARSICAYGFEPNPQHTPRLQMLQRRLMARLWPRQQGRLWRCGASSMAHASRKLLPGRKSTCSASLQASTCTGTRTTTSLLSIR